MSRLLEGDYSDQLVFDLRQLELALEVVVARLAKISTRNDSVEPAHRRYVSLGIA